MAERFGALLILDEGSVCEAHLAACFAEVELRCGVVTTPAGAPAGGYSFAVAIVWARARRPRGITRLGGGPQTAVGTYDGSGQHQHKTDYLARAHGSSPERAASTPATWSSQVHVTNVLDTAGCQDLSGLHQLEDLVEDVVRDLEGLHSVSPLRSGAGSSGSCSSTISSSSPSSVFMAALTSGGASLWPTALSRALDSARNASTSGSPAGVAFFHKQWGARSIGRGRA